MLWILLPLAVLVAGLAPAVISFAAGQAAFTITLLILYNIIAPAGWRVGLVRVEDVAIGSAVSLLVGALFWPRGAASALGQALSEAYSETARYLNRAVQFGVVRCDRLLPETPAPREESLRAAAASRRLDDAFRGFLAERGPKHLPLPDVAALITGVAVLRLGADAVVDLWQQDGGAAPAGDRTAARNEVLGAETLVSSWYEAMARALAGSGDVPAELPADGAADGRLIDAVQRDLSGTDGQGTAAAVRMIWTADHVDAARRMQARIIAPARLAAAYLRRARRPLVPRGHRTARPARPPPLRPETERTSRRETERGSRPGKARAHRPEKARGSRPGKARAHRPGKQRGDVGVPFRAAGRAEDDGLRAGRVILGEPGRDRIRIAVQQVPVSQGLEVLGVDAAHELHGLAPGPPGVVVNAAPDEQGPAQGAAGTAQPARAKARAWARLRAKDPGLTM